MHVVWTAFKGRVSRDFRLLFFSWISFPQAPEYTIRAVSNFFENLRRYSQLKVQICHRCRWYRWCILTYEYLREFSKKFEMVLMGYSGAGGKLIHEKNQKQRISWHCPCIAPMVWPFLSTTAQLYATHRRGGRRGKRHSSSAQEWGHSGVAWGDCVSQAAQAEWCYQGTPPLP